MGRRFLRPSRQKSRAFFPRCSRYAPRTRFLKFFSALYIAGSLLYNRTKIKRRCTSLTDFDFTRKFSVLGDRDAEIKQILTTVYNALQEKGYNPINQIVGYILSEDPTYITNYDNARTLIRRLDRDELLQVLLKSYLSD